MGEAGRVTRGRALVVVRGGPGDGGFQEGRQRQTLRASGSMLRPSWRFSRGSGLLAELDQVMLAPGRDYSDVSLLRV
jgi:hypothetical protein